MSPVLFYPHPGRCASDFSTITHFSQFVRRGFCRPGMKAYFDNAKKRKYLDLAQKQVCLRCFHYPSAQKRSGLFGSESGEVHEEYGNPAKGDMLNGMV